MLQQGGGDDARLFVKAPMNRLRIKARQIYNNHIKRKWNNPGNEQLRHSPNRIRNPKLQRLEFSIGW
jgi:hypothetical protein